MRESPFFCYKERWLEKQPQMWLNQAEMEKEFLLEKMKRDYEDMKRDFISGKELFRCYTCGQNRPQGHKCFNLSSIPDQLLKDPDILEQLLKWAVLQKEYNHRNLETDKKYE